MLGRRALRVARRRRPPRRWVRRLLTSGVFDRAYYEAQTGQSFDTDEHAARHFLAASPLRAFSFHPLVEGPWIDDQPGSQTREWHRRLFDDRTLRSTGPLFDATRAASGATTAADALRQFLATATESTQLPVNPQASPSTWGEARAALHRAASETAAQERRAMRRNARQWDADGEQRFLAGLRSPEDPGPAADPVVSIIMPTFNRGAVIDAAIRSVRQQSFTAWELIVVDDGSTDDTARVVDDGRAKDARIRYLPQANSGVSAARNNGVRQARGRYIAFLDSDNTWTPEFLRASLASLHAGARQASFTAVEIRGDGGDVEYLGARATREDLLDGRNLVDLNALVLKRDLLTQVGGFDEGLRRWVDYDLVLRVLRFAEIVYVPMIGVHYDHRSSAGDRITAKESPLWRNVVLNKNLVDWSEVRSALSSRTEGRTSVLVRTAGQWQNTLGTVRSLLEHGGTHDVEVVVVDNGSPRANFAVLTAAFLGDPRVSVHRVAGDLRTPTSSNVAFARSTGDIAVIVRPGVQAGNGWVEAARQAAEQVAPGPFDGFLFAAPATVVAARGGFSAMPDGDPTGERLQLDTRSTAHAHD